MGGCAFRSTRTPASLQRCGDTSLPDAQSFVRPAVEANNWLCGQSAGTCRAGCPDFSTLCRRQKTLSVAIPYKGSTGPLHLLIDSTGIKAEGEGEWNARKHGGPKRRLWRKIHIGIDEQTLEIRAIEVTSSSIGDAPISARPAQPNSTRPRARQRHG